MRHRFEPVRLVLGLWLIALAGAHVARAPQATVLAVLLAGVLAAALVGVATHLLRRHRAGRQGEGRKQG